MERWHGALYLLVNMRWTDIHFPLALLNYCIVENFYDMIMIDVSWPLIFSL